MLDIRNQEMANNDPKIFGLDPGSFETMFLEFVFELALVYGGLGFLFIFDLSILFGAFF